MAILTLAMAKGHLRVDSYDHDADIAMKLDQAEGIVLDYLKVQSNAIVSVSVANPAVVTTLTPHGLTSGVTYTLSGTTTTPTVNGAQVVTVTGPTTFTVPVNVTVGQADEAGIVGVPVWTTATLPMPVQAATLLVLTHLYEQRGDDMETDESLWASIGRLLMRRRDPALA